MEENIVLEIKNISSYVNKKFLVKEASFSLHSGEICAVIGDDRSGKSSLCKLIAGALPLTNGEIFIEGKNLKKHPSLRSEISVALNPPTFFKFQSVIENIKYLLKLRGKYNHKKVVEMLNKFSLLEKMNARVFSLTESEKKKLSLVVALSCDAKVYIFDEPLLNLTDADKEIFFEQIKQLKNCAVMITGNNKEDFEDIANTFIYLSNKEMAHIEANEKYKNFNQKRYSFILTKQPNFAGKVIKENKNIDVLIEENKALFPKVSENELEEILKLLVEKKITIYSAGFKENGIEQVAENLKKYFKDKNDKK